MTQQRNRRRFFCPLDIRRCEHHRTIPGLSNHWRQVLHLYKTIWYPKIPWRNSWTNERRNTQIFDSDFLVWLTDCGLSLRVAEGVDWSCRIITTPRSTIFSLFCECLSLLGSGLIVVASFVFRCWCWFVCLFSFSCSSLQLLNQLRSGAGRKGKEWTALRRN